MCRSDGIVEAVNMLEAVQRHCELANVLKHRPACRITPEILRSQKDLECMKLLLNIDPETAVTEGVVFRALEMGSDSSYNFSGQEPQGKDVLETLLDRNSAITVTEKMLQAVRCSADMEILLKHLEPGTPISTDVVAALSKIKSGEGYLTMRPLLNFNPSIRLDPKIVLQTIGHSDGVDALEMLLEHDPVMPVNRANVSANL